VADLIDRLEKKIRRHTLAAFPPGAPAELETIDLGDLLHAYGNWRGRLIAPAPRKVRTSDGLSEYLEGRLDPRIDRLRGKIEAGDDLTPHLSRAVAVVLRRRRHRPAPTPPGP
jgi:hypothetical protein